LENGWLALERSLRTADGGQGAGGEGVFFLFVISSNLVVIRSKLSENTRKVDLVNLVDFVEGFIYIIKR